ncbi:MAG: CHASE2 domain-containing protein [Planctomycetes bacterium]|nr:CHASE2 domain-containing protein [Planctomycetota bacterium]
MPPKAKIKAKKTPQHKKLKFGLAAGVLIAVFCCVGSTIGIFNMFEYRLYDLRMRMTSTPEEASKDIVAVIIDDYSLTKMEFEQGKSWTWPRSTYGEITSYLDHSGAKAMMFDLILPEKPEENVSSAQNFANAVGDYKHAVIGLTLSRVAHGTFETMGELRDQKLAQLVDFRSEFMQVNPEWSEYEGDRIIGRIPEVMWDGVLDDKKRDFLRYQDIVTKLRTKQLMVEAAQRIYRTQAQIAVDVQREIDLDSYVEAEPPYLRLMIGKVEDGVNVDGDRFLEELLGTEGRIESLVGVIPGDPSLNEDSDGTTRRSSFFRRFYPDGTDNDPIYVPTMAFAVVLDMLQPKEIVVDKDGLWLKGLIGGADDILIPVDKNGRAMINYWGRLMHDPADVTKWAKEDPEFTKRSWEETDPEKRTVYRTFRFYDVFISALNFNASKRGQQFIETEIEKVGAELQAAISAVDEPERVYLEALRAQEAGTFTPDPIEFYTNEVARLEEKIKALSETPLSYEDVKLKFDREQSARNGLSTYVYFIDENQIVKPAEEVVTTIREVYQSKVNLVAALEPLIIRMENGEPLMLSDLPPEMGQVQLSEIETQLNRMRLFLSRYTGWKEQPEVWEQRVPVFRGQRFDALKTDFEDAQKKAEGLKDRYDELLQSREGSEDYIEALIDGKLIIDPALFKDKIIAVGALASGLLDLKPTPFSSRDPGMVVHMSIIDSVLQRKFLVSAKEFQNWIAIIVMCVLSAAAAVAVPRVWMSLPAIAAVVGLYSFANLKLFASGQVYDLSAPMLGAVLSFAGGMLVGYFTEGKQKSEMKGAFSKMVSPDVVDEVMSNPDSLQLGGQRRELTVYFSDLAGFTTISELLPPEELVELLNEYLERMTRILMSDHLGTVDKYIGDAIMTFWNAPNPQPDHAKRACFAALDNYRKLCSWREELMEEGHPKLDQRIGINTGPAVVGMMGSSDRLNYTVIGDTINLGARLEAAGKEYKCNMIIGQQTFEEAKEHIFARKLDMLQVKGKTVGVQVYELFAKVYTKKGEDRKSEVTVREFTEEQTKFLRLYEEAWEIHRQRKWDEAIAKFEECIAARKNAGLAQELYIPAEDGPAKVMIKRCEEYKINPPHVPEGQEWDGVMRLTTK